MKQKTVSYLSHKKANKDKDRKKKKQEESAECPGRCCREIQIQIE
jgi:hypothetical protein